MDSRDLTYVLTVRDTQNFSKAAQRLFISQPSLSQYIRRLEQRLGEPIFFRDKAQVMLTPFGEVYAREAEKLLDCIHQMEETLHLAKERNRSMIRVGISQSYSQRCLYLIQSNDSRDFEHPRVHFNRCCTDWLSS